jgi:hypothetical protein
MSNVPTLPPRPDSSSVDPGHGTRDPGLPSSAIYHCSHCGYNLHSIPITGKCPECGQSASTRLAPDAFLKNDTSRKFFISKSLHLIQLAIDIDLAASVFKFSVLVLGFRHFAAYCNLMLMGLWLVLVSLGTYLLFYGITRVNKKGYPVLARSILLYMTASLATLYLLQEWTVWGDFLPGSQIPSILLRFYAPKSLFVLVSVAVIFLLLYGLHLASKRLGLFAPARRLVILGATWAFLCFLIYFTTPNWLEPWAHHTAAQPSPLTLLSLPPNTANSRGYRNFRTFSDDMRFQNAKRVNFLGRVDPGPGFWSEVAGSAIGHAVADINANSSAIGARNYRIPRLPDHLSLAISDTSLIQIEPRFTNINRFPGATGPVGISQVHFALPELLLTFAASILSLFFSISLWLLLSRLRKALDLLAPK